MKVVIVDDHAIVREGVAQVLKAFEEVSEVLEAATFAELSPILDDHRDVRLILLDIKMSDGATVERLVRLRDRAPGVAVAILSAQEDPVIARDYLANGAAGYIPKSSTRDVLVNAVKLMLAGGIYIPPFVLSNAGADGDGEYDGVEPISLTRRQYDVLQRMAHGLSNKGIARELNVSESTVKTHASAILRALGVDNRMKAVSLGMKRGIIAER